MNATSAGAKQVYRVIIQAPVEKVWAVLTQTDVVLPFFFCSVLRTTKLASGAPIRMQTPNGKNTGVAGEVLEFDPPKRFSHTFKFTNYDDPLCIVTYDLKPVEGGTEFTLTSDRVPVGTKTEKQMAAGGKLIANSLKTLVETGRPSFVSRMIGWVNVVMGPFTPRKCRSENWPLDKKIQ
jgi:uncharacterized protein YndB with AHSA1/START domain